MDSLTPLFWKHKIELNQARDYRNRVDLELLGWKVITVWECELKTDKREETLPHQQTIPQRGYHQHLFGE